MRLAADKLGHLKAGVAAAAAGAIIGALVAAAVVAILGLDDAAAFLVGSVAAAAGALICGATAGLTKEFADHADNKLYPGMHGVELADAWMTALPGAFVCLALLANLALRL